MRIAIKQVLGILALLMLAVANGWHLGAVQLYAWSNMAYENSEHMALSDAIQKAMDGTEICGICQIVADAQNEQPEFQFNLLDLTSKVIFFTTATAPIIPARNDSWQTTIDVLSIPNSWCSDTATGPPKIFTIV